MTGKGSMFRGHFCCEVTEKDSRLKKEEKDSGDAFVFPCKSPCCTLGGDTGSGSAPRDS